MMPPRLSSRSEPRREKSRRGKRLRRGRARFRRVSAPVSASISDEGLIADLLYVDYFRATGLDALYPLWAGNRFRFYTSGQSVFRAMERGIDSAQSSINIEVYIFRPDQTGTRMRDRLAQAQGRGVQVNLLIDAVGSFETPDSFFAPLTDVGGRVVRFNPIFGWRRRWRNPNQRDHRKILVVDGRIAFAGGMNVGDEYAAPVGDPTGWRDTHARVVGPAVCAIQRLFLDHFEWETGIRPVDRTYLKEVGPVRWGTTFVRVVGGAPGTRVRPLRRAYAYAIRRARRRVFLTTGYFVPPGRFIRTLKRAARRGVDVRLLVPARSDHPFVLRAGQRFYAQILRSGIRIYEWVLSPLHAKSAVVDDVWGVVGSANLDVRSFEVNYEADLHVLGADVGRRLSRAFLRDLKRSRELTLARWQCRGLLARLLERFCALFRRFL